MAPRRIPLVQRPGTRTQLSMPPEIPSSFQNRLTRLRQTISRTKKTSTTTRRKRPRSLWRANWPIVLDTSGRGDQLCLDVEHGISGSVHAGWVRSADLRTGEKEECVPFNDVEFCRVRVRFSGVLRCRIRIPVWGGSDQCGAEQSRRRPYFEQVPHRPRTMGICRRQGFFLSGPCVRCWQQLPRLVRSRLHGNGRLHHCRRDLRTHYVLGIPAMRTFCRSDPLSDLRLLDLGRRLVVTTWIDDESRSRLHRLCRIKRGARSRRILRHGPGNCSRASIRQVWSRRENSRISCSQRRLRGHRDIHSAIRLDGIQSGIDVGSDRSAYIPSSPSTRTSRQSPVQPRRCSSGTFAFGKPDITMACNGMLAGLVAITTARARSFRPSLRVVHTEYSRERFCGGVIFPNERVLKIDDPCGAISVHGYCGFREQSPSASLPTARTASDGTASAQPVTWGARAKA